MRQYNVVGFADNELHAAIQAKYGSDEKEMSIAEQVAEIAGEFTRTKGASPERQKRRDYRRSARRYISEKAKERIKPVGFIGGFIFMAILSGIISWLVKKLLDQYFGPTDSKTMELEDLEDNLLEG